MDGMSMIQLMIPDRSTFTKDDIVTVDADSYDL